MLFVSNGYYLYFKYLQYNIQHIIQQEIKKGMNEKELSLIIVSVKNKKEIFWIKKNKEFKYKDKMYDVVKIKILNKQKYFYCINDIKEKHLITIFSENNKRKNNLVLKLSKILNNKYFPKTYFVNIHFNPIEVRFTENNLFYKSKIIDIISPPPKS